MNKRYFQAAVLTPALVFVAGLLMAAVSAWWQEQQILSGAASEFQRGAERVTGEIARRFNLPVYGLNGARGAFMAAGGMKRAQFKDYVDSRDLPREFSGVRGFGFIQPVARADLDSFIAAERADGAPQFSVGQFAGEALDPLYVIKFIEPAADNIGFLGLDVGSQAVRREALLRSIDSAQPTITVAPNVATRPAVLLYVPMYAKGAPIGSVDERRAALVGIFFAPVVIAELLDKMPDLIDGGVDFDLFHGNPDGSGARLLYDTDKHSAQSDNAIAAPKDRRFSRLGRLDLNGGDYWVRANSTAKFDAAVDWSRAWLILIVGAVVSGLFAVLVRQQIDHRHRAELLAHRMTERLRLDEERSRDFSLSGSDWFWESDLQHRFSYCSDNFEASCGVPSSEVLGKTRVELLGRNPLNPPDQTARHWATLEAHLPFKNFEYQAQTTALESRWLSASGVPHFDKYGHFAGYRGTGCVITERKNIERKLQQQHDRLAAIIESFPGGISLFDADLKLVAHNKQFRDLLDFPDSLFEQPELEFADLIRHNAQRGEYGAGEVDKQVAAAVLRARNFQSHRFERVRPNGRVLEIIGLPLPGGGFVSIYMDITERKKMEEQVRQLAFYDPLTNLANRRLLHDRLGLAMAASKRSGRYAAVMFLDLDNFKPLNDLHGHEIGDLLLVEVARRLTACVREIDTVARFGGDEFVIMLNELHLNVAESHEQARTIAEKVRLSLSEPYELQVNRGDVEPVAVTHRCAASIGVTLFWGYIGTADEVLKCADGAMYQAKAAGRNAVVFHDSNFDLAPAELDEEPDQTAT